MSYQTAILVMSLDCNRDRMQFRYAYPLSNHYSSISLRGQVEFNLPPWPCLRFQSPHSHCASCNFHSAHNWKGMCPEAGKVGWFFFVKTRKVWCNAGFPQILTLVYTSPNILLLNTSLHISENSQWFSKQRWLFAWRFSAALASMMFESLKSSIFFMCK